MNVEFVLFLVDTIIIKCYNKINQVNFLFYLQSLTGVIGMRKISDQHIDIHRCPSTVAAPHSHQFLELVYVTEGTAVHKINGTNPTVIRPGDYFIIDYETEHEYYSEEEHFCVINCLFLPELLDKSLVYCRDFQTLLHHYLLKISTETMHFNPANHFFHDDDLKIQPILEEMLTEYNEKPSNWSEMVRANLVKLLIYTARKIPTSGKNLGFIDTIINNINENFSKHITLSDMISGMNYSLPYISKKFKTETGLSFQNYLKRTRINEACRLLAYSDKKIEEISVLSGYSDPDHFRKAFKDVMQLTPNAFRCRLRRETVGDI